MRLFVQIPCYNERETLRDTLADLPRSVPGIDEIEVLVVDDGSRDGTAERAAELGVHHVLRFPRNRGLSAAHAAGIDACLRLGADVIVNTDADNQYRGSDIPRLVAPVVEGRADIVIGDRDPGAIPEFSPIKRWLQRWGSRLVRTVSGTDVADSTSGFRAYSRRAATTMFVHNRFSYTLESILQAGQAGLAIENVPIGTNPSTRQSRLASSTAAYVRRNGPVIFRSYAMYWPVRTFGVLAAVLLALGLGLGARFLWFYVQDPGYSGHVQSLLVGVGAVILAFLVGLMAMLGDLMAANRRLAEETLVRVRRLEATRPPHAAPDGPSRPVDGLRSTGAAPWRPA